MAKSSRSSTKKENNRRKAASVFGPAEDKRAQRLSAKLLELAKAPKPETSDVNMDDEKNDATIEATESTMDVDSARPAKARIGKKRIDKRRQKKASIVFPKYSDKLKAKKKKTA